MKRWIRLAWLFLSGAWFVRLQLIPVLMWARWPLSNPPRGVALWVQVLRDWRHGRFLFVTAAILTLGFVLEIAGRRAAAWVNIAFYGAYVLLLFVGGRLLDTFGESALVILIVNCFLVSSAGEK
jgi:hypothetical protein